MTRKLVGYSTVGTNNKEKAEEFYNAIFTGLLNTDKRKKYPIDQFRSFLGFEE